MPGTGIRAMMDLDRANFSTVEKDFRDITERLLGNEKIVKLLYYSVPDCLAEDKYEVTPEIIQEVAQENLRVVPSIRVPENKGSYIIVTFDSFMPNKSNPKFIDNAIIIDVLCPADVWTMDSYMMRPFHIMHEVQGELNEKTLNGIGKVYFIGGNLLNLGEYVGYQMTFSVINDA